MISSESILLPVIVFAPVDHNILIHSVFATLLFSHSGSCGSYGSCNFSVCPHSSYLKWICINRKPYFVIDDPFSTAFFSFFFFCLFPLHKSKWQCVDTIRAEIWNAEKAPLCEALKSYLVPDIEINVLKKLGSGIAFELVRSLASVSAMWMVSQKQET